MPNSKPHTASQYRAFFKLVLQELRGLKESSDVCDALYPNVFSDMNGLLEWMESNSRELAEIITDLKPVDTDGYPPGLLQKLVQKVDEYEVWLRAAQDKLRGQRQTVNRLKQKQLDLRDEIASLFERETRIRTLLDSSHLGHLVPQATSCFSLPASLQSGPSDTVVLVVQDVTNHGVKELMRNGELKQWNWERHDNGAEVEEVFEAIPSRLVFATNIPHDLAEAHRHLRPLFSPYMHTRNNLKVAILLPPVRTYPPLTDTPHRTAILLYSDPGGAACAIHKSRDTKYEVSRASLKNVQSKVAPLIQRVLELYNYKEPQDPPKRMTLRGVPAAAGLEQLFHLCADIRQVASKVCLTQTEGRAEREQVTSAMKDSVQLLEVRLKRARKFQDSGET